MLKRFFAYLQKPLVLTTINAALIAAMLVMNIFIQGFCIPTTWASVVLLVGFGFIIISPIAIKNPRLAAFSSFINGFSFCVMLYCVLFLEQVNWYGLLGVIMGIGLVVLVPHFLAVQLLWVNVIKPSAGRSRSLFLLGVGISLGIAAYAGFAYNKGIQAITQFEKSNYTELEKNFMTEKILGMHFIYHTRICEYDGWRPPKHEPLLVVGMWLNGRKDPMDVSLKTRLELYKKFFPEKPYKFDCSCAREYSWNYHNDPLWE